MTHISKETRLNMMKKQTLLCLMIVFLSGCGEFAYKRGASVKDLENTKKTCQSVTEQDMEKCLNDHGWVVKKLDNIEFMHEELPSENTASDFVLPELDIKQPSKIAITEKDSAIDTTQTQTKLAEVPAVKTDLFETFKISSWWKTAGNDVKFQADIQHCKSELGELHYPDMTKQLYSKAFITCMYKHGWKALGKIK